MTLMIRALSNGRRVQEKTLVTARVGLSRVSQRHHAQTPTFYFANEMRKSGVSSANCEPQVPSSNKRFSFFTREIEMAMIRADR